MVPGPIGNGHGVELTHLGHSCVLLDTGDARILLDPGVFSAGFGTLEGLDAVLVTHQHPDHLAVDDLPALMARNPDAALVVDPGTASDLAGLSGIEHTVRSPGERFTVRGATVDVLGGDHAVIHPDLPVIPNNGYLVTGGDTTVLHPGDAFVRAPQRPDVLLLPTAAPWMAISEAIDYLRGVAPPLAVPIHEAVLSRPGIYHQHFTNLAPAGSEVRIAEPGRAFRP